MKESVIETEVTYAIERDGKLLVIEHVPARVSVETGEQCFAPATVQRIQALIQCNEKPDRFMQTPVFEFSASR